MDTEIGGKPGVLQQDLEPDYHFWLQKDVWQLLEAAKLICGRDPQGKFPGRPRYNGELKVIGVIDKAYAAVKLHELPAVRDALIPNHVLLEPRAFLDWCKKSGLAIPQGLTRSDHQAGLSPSALRDVTRERAIAVARTLWMVDAKLSLSDVLTHRAMHYIVADDRFTTAQIAEWIIEYQPA